MKKLFGRLLGVLFLGAMSSLAIADARLSIQQGGATVLQPIYIHQGQLRAQTVGSSKYLLFDARKGLFTQVDDARRTYASMEQKTLLSLAQTVSQMKGSFLAQLPPEQKAQIDQAMKEQGLSLSEATEATRQLEALSFKKTNRQKQIQGKSCNVVEGWQGSSKKVELCVLDLATLHMSSDDYATLKAFLAFAQQAAGEVMGGKFSKIAIELGQDETHIPIQIIRFDAQQTGSAPVSVEVDTQAGLDKNLFSVPAGYQNQSIGLLR